MGFRYPPNIAKSRPANHWKHILTQVRQKTGKKGTGQLSLQWLDFVQIQLNIDIFGVRKSCFSFFSVFSTK